MTSRNHLHSIGLASLLSVAAAPRPSSTDPARSPATQPAKAAVRTSVLATSSPIVSLRLEFRAGSVDDPAGKEGLAALAAALIGEGGTKDLSYAQVLEQLYPMAARIGAYADKEITVFTGEVHRDHLERFYTIFRDLLLRPRFDPADFARLRTDAENALTTGLRGSDDEELGKWTLQTALHRGHPYGHVDVGTVQGLRAITLDDVKSFVAARYATSRLTVGVAGGFPEGFPSRIAADFARLPEKAAEATAIPAVKARPGRRATLVEKEALASAISWGFPIALNRSSDDFFALMIANSYLGEHRTFNGVLMNQLRGARGLNYGDYSYIENFIQDGYSTFPMPGTPRSQQYFSVWIRPVKPENAPFALRASLYHLEKLIREGIPEAGFAQTREFLLGYSRLWAQSTGRRLGYQMDSERYGRGDFLREIQERLPKITKAQVDAAVRKYLDTANLEIAIVCDRAADLKARLVGAAPTPIRYDTEGTPKAILDEDAIIAAYPLGLDAKGVTIVPVAEMFER